MTINRNKINKYGVLVSSLVMVFLCIQLIHEVDIRHWKIQSPIIWTLKQPEVKEIKEAKAAEIPDPLNPNDRYICNKFGDQCKVALAIVKAESHSNSNAINKNKDGSYDIGCWQINSVHLNRWSIAQMADCKTATDIAYEIYQEQGFKPWVAYTSKNYLKFYEK